MKFLADESVDRQIVDRLRRDGHAGNQHPGELPGTFAVLVPGSFRIRKF